MLANDTDPLIQLDQRPVWDKTTESCPAGGRGLLRVEAFSSASVEISRLKIIRRMAAFGAERKRVTPPTTSAHHPRTVVRAGAIRRQGLRQRRPSNHIEDGPS